MSQRDKNNILIVLTVLAFIVVTVSFIFGTKILPLNILLFITLFAEYFLVVPKINYNYYRIFNQEPPKVRWFPLLNELTLMTKHMATLNIVVLCILVIMIILWKLPLNIVSRFRGLQATLGWGYDMAVLIILTIVLVNVALGIGLISVLRNVDIHLQKYVNTQDTVWNYIFYLLAFIPGIRLCFFLVVNSKLNSLIQTGYLQQEDNNLEFKEEVYNE